MSSRRFCVRPTDPGQLLGAWPDQPGVVGLPGLLVGRRASCRRRLSASRSAAPRASSCVAPNPRARTAVPSTLSATLRRPDDVAVPCGREGRRQCVAGVELDEAVARAADEAARCRGERAVEGGEDWLRIVAIGGVRRGDRVGGDQDRMAGRGVDRRVVGAAVAGPAATVAVDRRIESNVEQLQAARDAA